MRGVPRRAAMVALFAGLLAALGSCSPSESGTQTEPRGSETSARPTHQPHRPGSGQPTVSKVLVFVVENHSLDQMRAQMPYTFSLAEHYGYTTSYHALTHPSLGNYLAIAGGSTFGITDDNSPAAHPIHGPSVFSQALAAGDTAATYAEGMPDACALNDGGDQYVVRHNPWTYFVDDRAACTRFDVPGVHLLPAVRSGRLPNVGLVIPNLCNDAHDCGLATADDWLHGVMEKVLAGPDWRSGHLAIVISADEDDYSADNLVLTTVVDPGLHHVVVDAPLTHLSLSAFLSEVVHQPPLRKAAGAPSLVDAFGLRVTP
ncbi:MAG TPA: alkaline phosphatase family protein [Nocardioidaceae bacterium]|nr:alkaline phosphatase family protein [Nocardioidaceae bacterium]